MAGSDDEFEALLAQSSLGSPGARELRRRTGAREVAMARRIAELRAQVRAGNAGEHERIRSELQSLLRGLDVPRPSPGAAPARGGAQPAAGAGPGAGRAAEERRPAGTALATVTATASDVAVLHLRGELDADTASQLRSVLADLLERPVPRVVVDLSELKFCDSVGLSAFITAKQVIVARGGWLAFAGANPFMLRLMETVGLSRYFAIFPDVEAAIAAAEI